MIAAPAPSCPRLCCFSRSSESLVPPKSPTPPAVAFLRTAIATAHSCFSSSDMACYSAGTAFPLARARTTSDAPEAQSPTQ